MTLNRSKAAGFADSDFADMGAGHLDDLAPPGFVGGYGHTAGRAVSSRMAFGLAPDAALILTEAESVIPGQRTLAKVGIEVGSSRQPMLALEALRASPRLVLVDGDARGARRFLACLRTEGGRIARLPAIGLVRKVEGEQVFDLLRWGVNEVVPLDASGMLTEVARSLVDFEAPVPSDVSHTTVILGGGNRDRLLDLAHPLRNSGYRAIFVRDRREFWARVTGPGATFAVVDLDLFESWESGLRALCAEARREMPLVITVPEDRLDALSSTLRPYPSVRVVSRRTPPEVAILNGHVLLRATRYERRMSERLPYSTVVTFRPEGRPYTSMGVTYDISAQGLGVRSMVPPQLGSHVWLELMLSHVHVRVRVRALVVWTRNVGLAGGPDHRRGFGCRIVGGSGGDLASWREGYTGLLWARCKAE